jgi:acyl-CoA synthetase (AMP-forming)/AMP-acid ligase II
MGFEAARRAPRSASRELHHVTAASRHYATVWESIADHIPSSPALRHGGRRLDWAEFEARSARLAGGFAASGVGPGVGVACFLYNGPEYFEVFFAALKLRAVPSNINYRYRSDELLALLDNAEAQVLVYDTALRAQVEAVVDRAPSLRLLVEVGRAPGDEAGPGVGYEELVRDSTAAPRIERADDDVFLGYTGGTTGLPKGVLFDIGRSLGNSVRFRDLFTDVGGGVDPLDVSVERAALGQPLRAIPASPLMHSTGFIFASLPTLTAGGEVTTLQSRSFDPHELLRTIDEVHAQVVAIVGDAFALPIVRALDEGRPDGTAYDGGSLRAIVSAGVGWSASIKARLLEHLPEATLIDSCGTTEGVAYGTRRVRRGDTPATSTFDAVPGLKVMTPDREELGVGEVGLLAGTTTASGYHRDPRRTDDTFFWLGAERYVMPGDLGRIDADGTVTLIGRGFATINTGGEKVFPAEVEDAIRSLDEVDDCLVLGVPDERFGQAVAALVVPRPGADVTEADVEGVVRGSLAGYKVPRRVRVVAAVPRLPNGKIDYAAASALAGASVARAD